VRSGTVVIDVSSVRTSGALHDLLSDRLGFPGWYGRNWDAFWDCIRDPELSVMPLVLRIHGYEALLAQLPRDAQLLRGCLEDLPGERSDVRVEWGA
jgi:ribonuclease inhibitor